ncbi:MAG TPA: acylphosphatase [Candidatus Binataceae bacterium]|nr:acylphosphatase [Candidatus Binataceae bacterium]
MSETGEQLRLHLLISGRVQGVFFRAAAAHEAQGLGLRGWARNLADGRVEIEVEGSAAQLRMFRAWANQGPPTARVDAVEERWLEAAGMAAGFVVR